MVKTLAILQAKMTSSDSVFEAKFYSPFDKKYYGYNEGMGFKTFYSDADIAKFNAYRSNFTSQNGHSIALEVDDAVDNAERDYNAFLQFLENHPLCVDSRNPQNEIGKPGYNKNLKGIPAYTLTILKEEVALNAGLLYSYRDMLNSGLSKTKEEIESVYYYFGMNPLGKSFNDLINEAFTIGTGWVCNKLDDYLKVFGLDKSPELLKLALRTSVMKGIMFIQDGGLFYHNNNLIGSEDDTIKFLRDNQAVQDTLLRELKMGKFSEVKAEKKVIVEEAKEKAEVKKYQSPLEKAREAKALKAASEKKNSVTVDTIPKATPDELKEEELEMEEELRSHVK